MSRGPVATPRASGASPVAALFQQAVAALRAGNPDAALNFAIQTLALDPRHPGALQLSAEVWARKGDARRAAEFLKRVPKSSRDWRVAANLGSALTQLGDPAGAERQFRLALKEKPDLPVLHFNLAHALDKQGRKKEAVDTYRRSLALDPALLECRVNLANLLGELKAYDEAEALLRGAAELAPARAEIAVNLGHLLKAMGRHGEAESWFRRALDLRPDIAPAQVEVARILADQGRGDEAETWLGRAIAHVEGDPDLALVIADYYQERDRFQEAEPYLRSVVSVRPDSGRPLMKLALTLQKLGRVEESEQFQQRFLNLEPASARDWEDRGRLLTLRGQHPEAIECYRKALRLDPSDAKFHAGLVFLLGYLPEIGPTELFQAHGEWARRHAEPLWDGTGAMPEDLRPGRRLRLGYLSPDLREHSVAYFLAPALSRHDHASFEVFCYSISRKEDEFTSRLRHHADHWLEAYRLSDEELARRIRQDRIDILVDLAGYTQGSRLLVLARKPAPIQVTWLGYGNTTGMRQIDYRLTDALADPPGAADALHSEKLLRLPGGFCCYQPRGDAPEPAAAPCVVKGYVSFGCFNNPDKINNRVIALWARILRELPEARLVLKGTGLDMSARRLRLEEAFRSQGIDPGRVELRAWKGTAVEHLREYADVDIALDPFPYNGVTTTCEALWMGVPVIALAGDRHAGRTGVSLLNHAGVPEWVAESEEKYVELALELARDPARLARYRSGLRGQMRASPLLDGATFTQQLESALRELWIGVCKEAGAVAAADEACGKPEPAPPRSPEERGNPADPGGDGEGMVATLPGGARLAVPRSVRLMTPFVLMEQGDWFEDEIRFVRRLLLPGVQAVDVGANYGVYALSMAMVVGESGRVWAFEPATSTSEWLRRSAALNRHSNLEVVRAALSDHCGTAQLVLDGNSELNRLSHSPEPGQRLEEVPLRTLDDVHSELGWGDIAFLKLDAEGEEARIVDGGRRFLGAQSPVIMFELWHGREVNQELIGAVQALGYDTYRLLPGLGLLAPVNPAEPPDVGQLNLFGVKAAKAAELEARGLLARCGELPAAPVLSCREILGKMPFSRKLGATWESGGGDNDHLRGLSFLLAALDESGAPCARWGSLIEACQALQAGCEERPSEARLATLSRAWFAGGWRRPAVKLLDQLQAVAESGSDPRLDEPFLPPSPRFAEVEPHGSFADWFHAAVQEQRELCGHYSSYFTGRAALQRIATLRRLGYLSPALELRERLIRERFGGGLGGAEAVAPR